MIRLNEFIDGKKIKGRWKLSRLGELEYSSDGKDEHARLKAPLVAAEPEALVAALTVKRSAEKTVTRLVKLTGTWKADPKNRLVFEVERESGRNDDLTFRGAWELNDSQEIVYRTRQTRLKTKTRRDSELVFRGYWDFSEKNRLVYSMSGDSGSAFRFRSAFQTKSILAKDGEIRYQLGVEGGGTRRLRTVTLFGRWVVSKDFGLSFEMETASGRRRSFAFGCDFHLRGGTVSAALKNRRGEPLGVEVVFTKKFLW